MNKVVEQEVYKDFVYLVSYRGEMIKNSRKFKYWMYHFNYTSAMDYYVIRHCWHGNLDRIYLAIWTSIIVEQEV